MSDKTVGNSITEENVVSKVAELMDTIDRVKRYNALLVLLNSFQYSL